MVNSRFLAIPLALCISAATFSSCSSGGGQSAGSSPSPTYVTGIEKIQAQPTPSAGLVNVYDEKQEMKKSYKRFIRALRAGDEETTLSLLSERSVQELKKLQKRAAKAGPSQLGTLNAVEKLAVGALRVSKAEHASAPRAVKVLMDYLVLAVDRKKVPELGAISVSGDVGSVSFRIKDVQQFFRMDVYVEDEVWKLDWFDTFALASASFEYVAQQEGTDIDRLILGVLTLKSGRQIAESIWDKPNQTV